MGSEFLILCPPRQFIASVARLSQVLAAGVEQQIDLMIRDKARAGALMVGVLFPFVTSARLDDPDHDDHGP